MIKTMFGELFGELFDDCLVIDFVHFCMGGRSVRWFAEAQ